MNLCLNYGRRGKDGICDTCWPIIHMDIHRSHTDFVDMPVVGFLYHHLNAAVEWDDGVDRPGEIWSRWNVRLAPQTQEVSVMPKKRYTPEEIIQHLRTVEMETGKGVPVLDASRKLGITEQTYYRWKKKYGGLRVDQAKRLKSLEQENARLKRIVADQAVDLSILKEVASGNF